ncbi:Gfo/Idh/MocA family protein [Roseibacillus persicicus]|uniref:Gfo/Idh/MocA family protein n=1 Tax=Roseibacillus persicicus TaxID=454148 RepID=UPI00280E0DF1|nr:Gfo/Idh/MocA family oxidoreductase [Roseibacillus persicicus]MDQ8190099.1 Gfo/Idh/MocA family oxidoreductase [Roseibacillus persicicus]
MKSTTHPSTQSLLKISRRSVLNTFGLGSAAILLLGTSGISAQEEEKEPQPIRWGFVGTGSIANQMARATKDSPNAVLTASSSRTLEKAEAFAAKYEASKAFDSWAEMCQWDGIDAVYVATPTSVKEEISIAAAKAGKHVLCEKPLPSLPATQRIITACRENNVAFMDGTHFSHHPRTLQLQKEIDTLVGKRRTLDSIFQFRIGDKTNIRMSTELEPMGALGDAGWYNMRAIVDYLDPSAELQSVSAIIRREPETQAVIGSTGLLVFSDGSSSTFSCSFDAGESRNEARIVGNQGSLDIPNFLGHDRDNSASYTHSARTNKSGKETVKVEADRPDAALMFEDFAAQVHDPSLRKNWETKSERTQALLDAVWASALANEDSRE